MFSGTDVYLATIAKCKKNCFYRLFYYKKFDIVVVVFGLHCNVLLFALLILCVFTFHCKHFKLLFTVKKGPFTVYCFKKADITVDC